VEIGLIGKEDQLKADEIKENTNYINNDLNFDLVKNTNLDNIQINQKEDQNIHKEDNAKNQPTDKNKIIPQKTIEKTKLHNYPINENNLADNSVEIKLENQIKSRINSAKTNRYFPISTPLIIDNSENYIHYINSINNTTNQSNIDNITDIKFNSNHNRFQTNKSNKIYKKISEFNAQIFNKNDTNNENKIRKETLNFFNNNIDNEINPNLKDSDKFLKYQINNKTPNPRLNDSIDKDNKNKNLSYIEQYKINIEKTIEKDNVNNQLLRNSNVNNNGLNFSNYILSNKLNYNLKNLEIVFCDSKDNKDENKKHSFAPFPLGVRGNNKIDPKNIFMNNIKIKSNIDLKNKANFDTKNKINNDNQNLNVDNNLIVVNQNESSLLPKFKTKLKYSCEFRKIDDLNFKRLGLKTVKVRMPVYQNISEKNQNVEKLRIVNLTLDSKQMIKNDNNKISLNNKDTLKGNIKHLKSAFGVKKVTANILLERKK